MQNRMQFRHVMLLLCISCYACAVERETYAPLFKCSTKLNHPYGICTHINRTGDRWEYDTRDKDLAMIDRTGATWIRADFDWNPYLQKEMKGEFSYRHHDEMMESVKSSGKELFGLLVPPTNRTQYNDWQIYIKNVVDRYKSDVKYWEVINEADLRYRHPVWKWLMADDYADLLKMGYTSIKSKDKKANVLFSGISNIDNHFMDSVLSHNVSHYFDIMTVHRYIPTNATPEFLCDYYVNLSDILKRYEIDKPVWLTETGCSTVPSWADEETQATWLPRIFLLSFAHGVDKVFWYKSRSCELDPNDKEHHYGLWHKDYVPKPAFYTYQALTKMCPDKSSRPKLVRDGQLFIASWKRPDGKKVWALWTSSSEKHVTLEVKGNYKCYDDRGILMNILLDDLMLSPSVVYIEGAKSVQLMNT